MSSPMENLQRYAVLLGRILLSLIFILSGLAKIGDWSGTAGYMASRGMRAIPFFLTMAIIFEVVGGLSVLAGWKARFGALALILFVISATLVFHNFWTYPQGQQQIQMVMFLKNLAIMGGLLLIFSFGPGAFSLDQRNKVQSRKRQ
jgi:putative oxidoreductase